MKTAFGIDISSTLLDGCDRFTPRSVLSAVIITLTRILTYPCVLRVRMTLRRR